MNIKFEIIDLVPDPLLVIRKVTSVNDLPQEIGKAYHQIAAYLNELGEQPAGVPFVAYYNLDMENLDVEMGFPVSRKLPACGEIKSSSLPIGPVVQTTFTGPYEEMAPVYEEMGQFVKDNGHETSGISIEYYLTGPDIPAEEQVTRIVFPIKKSM